MMTDPIATANTVIAAVVVGLIVGGILVALAARGNRLDEADRASRAFKELLAVAERCAAPEHRATLLREAARVWDVFEPIAAHASPAYVLPEQAPGYVHRLLDAYATGDPVNLSGCWVPPDVQGRLRAILAGAAEATTALPAAYARDGLVTSVRPVLPHEREHLRSGAGDG